MLAAARNKDAICKLLLDAGADGSLQDPSGKTAHDIAVAARAHDAASVIAASKVQSPNQAPTEDSQILEAGVLGGREEFAFSAAENQDIGHPPAAAGLALGITDPSLHPERHTPFSTENLLGEESVILTVSEPARTARADEEKERIDIDLDNDPGFDLSGWVVEEESPPPAADPAISVVAGATQAAISLHAPIDSSVEWDDVDVFLPDIASPLARAADTETRSQLRALLLCAIREGIASGHKIDELSSNVDGTPNLRLADVEGLELVNQDTTVEAGLLCSSLLHKFSLGPGVVSSIPLAAWHSSERQDTARLTPSAARPSRWCSAACGVPAAWSSAVRAPGTGRRCPG